MKKKGLNVCWFLFVLNTAAQAQVTNHFPSVGNVGVGTTSPEAAMDVRGTVIFDTGTDASLYTGRGTVELNRYLALVNSIGRQTASGLKAGGILVSDSYAFANPSKNELIVKGNIGVGTASPQSALDVRGGLTLYNGEVSAIYTGSGSQELNRYLSIYNSTGTGSASGLKVGGVLVSDSYAYANPSKSDLIVKGNVGIGTPSPQAKLAVNGNILAKEIKIKTDISVPDYVFEPDYDLATLAEIEAHIREHKHLPEIPSAADIQRDGLDLAEMNLLLLKKVEELTLHVIALKKELDDQKAFIKKVNQQPDNPITEAR